VLSPVDGLITGEHAHRWLEEGVRVYVESEYEALRVAGALGGRSMNCKSARRRHPGASDCLVRKNLLRSEALRSESRE